MDNRNMPSLPTPPDQSGGSSPKIPRQIEVIALRKGFFGNHRREEGDKFVISKMSQLGDWMECVDPTLEKQHQAIIKSKKIESAGE